MSEENRSLALFDFKDTKVMQPKEIVYNVEEKIKRLQYFGTQSTLYIAYFISEIKENNYISMVTYEEEGEQKKYKGIEEWAFKKFGFKDNYVRQLLNIVEYFMVKKEDYAENELPYDYKEPYNGFETSQLLEFITLVKPHKRKENGTMIDYSYEDKLKETILEGKINPTMTIKEIRKAIADYVKPPKKVPAESGNNEDSKVEIKQSEYDDLKEKASQTDTLIQMNSDYFVLVYNLLYKKGKKENLVREFEEKYKEFEISFAKKDDEVIVDVGQEGQEGQEQNNG